MTAEGRVKEKKQLLHSSNPNTPYISYFFFLLFENHQPYFISSAKDRRNRYNVQGHREREERTRQGHRKRTTVRKRKLKTKPHYKNNL